METEVAIVGGGPVGLSAAALLGSLGVNTTLIERTNRRRLIPADTSLTPVQWRFFDRLVAPMQWRAADCRPSATQA